MLPGEVVVPVARAWIGTPYHHQAATRGAGADCLGLIRGLFRELCARDPELPPAYTPHWGEYGGEELLMGGAERHLVRIDVAEHGLTLPPKRRVWEPGFVLLFRLKLNTVAKHCAVATGPTSDGPRL